MDGRRVPKMLAEVGAHGLEDLGEDGRARIIVEVDSAHQYIFYACLAARGTSARDRSVREFNHQGHEGTRRKSSIGFNPLCNFVSLVVHELARCRGAYESHTSTCFLVTAG